MMTWPTYRFDWGGDPADDLGRLHNEVNRLFSGYRAGSRFPAVNVWTSDESVKVVAELPGVEKDDLDIQIEGSTLEISGARKAPELKEGEQYLQQDQRYGSFRRLIELPYEVEPDNVKAKYANGVLEIALPRSEATKPRRIEIEAS